MRCPTLFAAAFAAIAFTAVSANAQLIFGYEANEPGLPYTGVPAAYTAGTSNVPSPAGPVTQGLQAITVSTTTGGFGGPRSSVLTDAGRVALFNTRPSITLDVQLPSVQLNFGNLDLHIFQGGNPNPALQDQETAFSLGNLGAFAPNSHQTVTIPLTGLQIGGNAQGHVELDPTLPWQYQIDIAVGYAAPITGGVTWGFDNMQAVPEPASIVGASIVLGGLVLGRRRK